MLSARFRTGEQGGFTLVELLTTMLLVGVLATFAVGAGRQFWLRRSLVAAQNDVVVTLREMQQRSVAESHPLVYGVRFQPNATGFRIYRYNPLTGTCTGQDEREFTSGVIVHEVDFGPLNQTSSGAPVSALCGGGDPESYVFFFARGTSTGGFVELRQPAVDTADIRRIEVGEVTGRVEAGPLADLEDTEE